MAVNVAMFWDDPVGQLRAVRKRMTPYWRIALTLQPRFPKATGGDAHLAGELMAGELMAGQMSEAGFGNVRLEWNPMTSVSSVAAVCALGER